MTCLNDDARNLIIDYIYQLEIPEKDQKDLEEFINEFSVCTTADVPKGKKRHERPVNRYNIFMSECLKENDMKMCIRRYREQKNR